MCEGNLLPDLPERRMGYKCFDCGKNVKERKRYFLGCYPVAEEVSKRNFRKRKKTSWLGYFIKKEKPARCPHCGSERVTGYYK